MTGQGTIARAHVSRTLAWWRAGSALLLLALLAGQLSWTGPRAWAAELGECGQSTIPGVCAVDDGAGTEYGTPVAIPVLFWPDSLLNGRSLGNVSLLKPLTFVVGYDPVLVANFNEYPMTPSTGPAVAGQRRVLSSQTATWMPTASPLRSIASSAG